MAAFVAERVVATYDADRHQIKTVVLSGGFVFEMIDGVVEYATALPQGLVVPYVTCTPKKSVLISDAGGVYSLHRGYLKQIAQCAGCVSAQIIDDVNLLIHSTTTLRLISWDQQDVVWKVNGEYHYVAWCPSRGHVAAASRCGTVCLFPAEATHPREAAVVMSLHGSIQRLEWAVLFSETILTVLQDVGSSRQLDMYSIVQEVDDGFVGNRERMTQMVHVCSVPFDALSMVRIIPAVASHVSDADKIFIAAMTPDGRGKWSSYRVAQRSVACHDIGGSIYSGELDTMRDAKDTLNCDLFEVLPVALDHQPSLSPKVALPEISTPMWVRFVVRLANGASCVAKLDRSSGNVYVEHRLTLGSEFCGGACHLSGPFVIFSRVQGDYSTKIVVLEKTSRLQLRILNTLTIAPGRPTSEQQLHAYMKSRCPDKLKLVDALRRSFGTDEKIISSLEPRFGLRDVAGATPRTIMCSNYSDNHQLTISMTDGSSFTISLESEDSCQLSLLPVDGASTVAEPQPQPFVLTADSLTVTSVIFGHCRQFKVPPEIFLRAAVRNIDGNSNALTSCVSVQNDLTIVLILHFEGTLELFRWDAISNGFLAYNQLLGVGAFCLTSSSGNNAVLFTQSNCLRTLNLKSYQSEAAAGVIPGSVLALVSGEFGAVVCATDIGIFLIEKPESTASLSGLLQEVNLRKLALGQYWDLLKRLLSTMIAAAPKGDESQAIHRLVRECQGNDFRPDNATPSRLDGIVIPSTTVLRATIASASIDRSGAFPVEVLEDVAEKLPNVQVEGVSSEDQMSVLCLVETLRASEQLFKGGVDAPAVRFLLDLKMRDMRKKLRLPMDPMRAESFLWACLSESQESLLVQCVPPVPSWDAIRGVGAPLWLRSLISLRQMAEQIGKAQYQSTREIRDCALMYCLANKKQLLIALCKACNDIRLQQFFSRDFNDEKNRTAAVSNAFVAIGKGNILFGATFFVLAGDGRSAAQVIINRLGDYVLALMVLRLCYNDEPSHLHWLLEAVRSEFAHQNKSLSGCESALFLWRAGDQVAAMRTLTTSVSSDSPCDEWLELLRHARQFVTTLTRRKNEFLDTAEEVQMLVKAIRRAWQSGDMIRAKMWASDLKSIVNNFQAEAAHPVGPPPPPKTQIVADFASGTIQFRMDDSDDEAPPPPQQVSTTIEAKPPTVGNPQFSTVLSSECQQLALQLAANVLGESEEESVEHEVEGAFFPDLRGSYTSVLSESLLERILLAAVHLCNDVPVEEQRLYLGGLALLLCRRAREKNDYALATALIATPCPLEFASASKNCISDYVQEVTSAKLQSLDRASSLSMDAPIPTVALSPEEATNVRRLLFDLTDVVICRRIRKAIAARTLPCEYRRTLLCFAAVSMFQSAAASLFAAVRYDIPEFGRFTKLFDCVKDAVRKRHRIARLSAKPAVEDDKRIVDLMQLYLHGSDDSVLPPLTLLHRTPILQSAAAKRASEVVKFHPAADELFALLKIQEGGLRETEYLWTLTHHSCEAREALLQASYEHSVALTERRILHHAPHGIVSLAVDHSTCDNIAISTFAGGLVLHGMRETVAGDNEHAVSQRSTERSAAVRMFANCFHPSQTVQRPPLGAATAAQLSSHPYLPFFFASQKTPSNVVDLFAFGSQDCVSSMCLSEPSCSLSRVRFSPNGCFFSVVNSSCGEITTWRFDSAVESADSAKLGKRVRCFNGSLHSFYHLSPYSSIVALGGNETSGLSSSTKGSAKQIATEMIKIVDTSITRSVLLSCEAPHAVEFMCFLDDRREIICMSGHGEVSLFDLRQNRFHEAKSRLDFKGGNASSKVFSVTAAEISIYDNFIALGTSSGQVAMLNSKRNMIADPLLQPDAVCSASFGSSPAKEVGVTSISVAPSSILFGLADGRVGAAAAIPSTAMELF